MNNYFETIDWPQIMSCDGIQDNWDIFKQLVSDAIIQYVPTSVNPLPGGQKVYQDQLIQSMLLFFNI